MTNQGMVYDAGMVQTGQSAAPHQGRPEFKMIWIARETDQDQYDESQ